MAKSDMCFSTQIIDGDGVFNITGIDNLIKEVRLGECGLSYAVVSIMGPIISGKSTLLNHLFGTNFREMDAFKRRSQTTKGIWLANCAGIEPCTLVMDLEGTDGRERGEDDTAFEKQSAVFAFAVSDIVLINMWCHDIGSEQAANGPLLRTVFQALMRLFSPRKTTLMFVLRDKTRRPLELLESLLREDVQKIWDSVFKPQAHKETPLSDFFNVEVVALSSYEEKEEQFKEQVARLRQQFIHSTEPGGLAGDRRGVNPASEFSFSTQKIWKLIKEDKYVDFPSHKVMVATVRCEQIGNEKFDCFAANEEWCHLDKTVQSGPVPGFGKKLSSILYTYLSEYDAATLYFDEGVKSATREQLKEKLLLLVQPAFQSLLGHIHHGTLEKFKKAFDKTLNRGEGFSEASRTSTAFYMAQFAEGCADAAIEEANWDTSKDSNELRHCIDAHIASVRVAKLSELTTLHEGRLKESLSEILEVVFCFGANNQTWPTIRDVLRRKTQLAFTGLIGALSGFDMDEQTKYTMLSSIEKYARGVVEEKAREEASKVLTRMIERFLCNFDSIRRVRTGNEDIRAITKTARYAALNLPSVMTVIHLDANDTDSIEDTLIGALMDSTKAAVNDGSITTFDPLASSTWEEFPSSRTLISPVQCKSLWLQFEETPVIQFILAQKANKPNNRSRPVGGTVLAAAVLSVLGSYIWNFMKKNKSGSNAGSGTHAICNSR